MTSPRLRPPSSPSHRRLSYPISGRSLFVIRKRLSKVNLFFSALMVEKSGEGTRVGDGEIVSLMANLTLDNDLAICKREDRYKNVNHGHYQGQFVCCHDFNHRRETIFERRMKRVRFDDVPRVRKASQSMMALPDRGVLRRDNLPAKSTSFCHSSSQARGLKNNRKVSSNRTLYLR